MAKGIRSIWVDSDTPESIGNKVIRDDVEIAVVPNGVQEYKDPDVVVNREYKYVIQSYTATSQSTNEVLGENLNYYTIVEATGLTPIMTNFRTDDTNKNRIYFDAPLGSVAGIDYQDFTIDGKAITAVNTTDNYFTLSADLNYYDNILIRKEGGNNTVVYDFTLEYIENLIDEPQTVNEKFVEVGASGSGDSLGDPMSITAAFTQASLNTTYWVKQGDYSSVNCTVGGSGSPDQPVKFIGYKTNPGDTPTLTRSVGMAFDSNEMPLLQNGSGAAIRNAQDYIFIRNFQLDNYAEYGINYSGAFFATYDNIFVKECQWSIRTIDEDSTNNRIVNSYVADSSQTGIEVQNNYNLIKSTWAVTSYASSMDYYLTHRGGEEGHSNCFIDCYINRFTGDSHSGHGISFRGDAYEANDSPSTLSLVQDCEIIGTKLELRNRMVYNNVFRNITITDGTGINLNDGANYNTLENVIVKNCDYFVNFYQSVENGGVNENANHNIFKNCIADDVPYIFTLGTYGITEPVQTYIQYNEWLNCTFINSPSLWVPLAAEDHVEIDNTNKFTNCIIEDIDSKGSGISDITYAYSDFWNSWTVESGTGNFAVDPELDANYKPQASFDLIDAPRIDGVYYDNNGDERENPTTIGAVMSAEEIPGVVVPTVTVSNTDGTADFSTIQAAVDSGLVAGDIVGLKGGDEFYGALSIVDVVNGDFDPVIFTSYGTGQATITGTKPIAGWVNQGGNIWTVNTGSDNAYQVIKNDIQLTKARFPNPVGKYAAQDNYLQIDSTTDGTHFICTDLIGVGDLVGGSAQVLTQDWILSSSVITAFNNTTGEVEIQDSLSLEVGLRFFINNAIDLVDEQDQWYFDTTTKTLTMYSDGMPTDIEVSTIDNHGITVNWSAVSFDNLIIKGFYQKGIYARDMQNGSVTNCTFINNYENSLYSHGITYGTGICSNNSFTGSNMGIVSYGFNAITFNTFNNIGLYNAITEKGYGATDGYKSTGSAIETTAGALTIEDNICTNLSYAGISFSTENASVKRNFVEDFNLTLHDGAGIYTYTGDFNDPGAEFSVIENNIILGRYFGTVHWGSQGIYLDGQTHDVTVQYNTVFTSRAGVFFNQNRRNISRYNNIFKPYYEGTRYSSGFEIGVPADKNISEYNNIYLEDGTTYGVYVISSIANNDDTHISNFNNIFNSQALNFFGISDNITPANLTDWDGSPLKISLSDWQTLTTQEDNTTVNTTMFYETIFSNQGVNVITNGTFEVDTSGWISASCTKTRVEHPESPGTYYMQVNQPTGNSRLNQNITTTVTGGEEWVLTFNAKVIDNRSKYRLWIYASDGSTLLHQEDIFIDEDWCAKQVVFTAPSNDSGFLLSFLINTATNNSVDQDISIDNVEMYSATVTEDKKALCEYNDTTSQVVRNLPSGTWKAMSDGTEYIGTITLNAFSSEILIKQ